MDKKQLIEEFQKTKPKKYVYFIAMFFVLIMYFIDKNLSNPMGYKFFVLLMIMLSGFSALENQFNKRLDILLKLVND